MRTRERGADGVYREQLGDDLTSNGVLWAINRVLFHPRGFALGYDREAHTFEVWGNGDEPWTFDSPVPENELYAAFETMLSEIRDAAAEEHE